MGLNIKKAETCRPAAQLAALTGETTTQAVTVAIRERIARVQRQRHVEEISARAQDMIRQFGGAAPYIDTENLSKHGLDFADAPAVFQSPQLTWLDTREDYGEDRWCSLGMLQGRVVVLVYTERVSDMVRILSLRKATRYERTQYDRFLQDRLGTG